MKSKTFNFKCVAQPLFLIKVVYLLVLFCIVLILFLISDTDNENIFHKLYFLVSGNIFLYFLGFLSINAYILFIRKDSLYKVNVRNIVQKIPQFLLAKSTTNIFVCLVFNYLLLFLLLFLSTFSSLLIIFSFGSLYASLTENNIYNNLGGKEMFWLIIFLIVLSTISFFLGKLCSVYFNSLTLKRINCKTFNYKKIYLINKRKNTLNNKHASIYQNLIHSVRNRIEIMKKNNNNSLLTKGFRRIFGVLFISLLFSLILLSINYLKVENQKSIYNKNKNIWIEAEISRIYDINKLAIRKYNNDIFIYNNNFKVYIKDTTNYSTKYKEFEKSRRIADTNFKKYEIIHKRWISKLNNEKRNRYNLIVKRRDDINDENMRSRNLDDRFHISKKDAEYSYSGELEKDNNWLIKIGEPSINQQIFFEPTFPSKPQKPQKPIQIKEYIVYYPSYDNINIRKPGFWEISFDRRPKMNILPTVILSFLTTFIIGYLILFLIFLFNRIKRLADLMNRISFRKLYVDLFNYLFPFRNKGTKRLLLSLTAFLTVIWTITWYLYLSNKTIVHRIGWHEKSIDYKIIFSDYVLIFSSFIFIPIIYIIGIWIYRGYKDDHIK